MSKESQLDLAFSLTKLSGLISISVPKYYYTLSQFYKRKTRRYCTFIKLLLSDNV